MLKRTLVGLAVFIAALVLLFGLEWLGIGWAGFFGPKRENVRREVFEKTQSYNRGVAQAIAKAQREYIAAPDSLKGPLKAVLRVQFADYEDESLDPELRRFLTEVRGY